MKNVLFIVCVLFLYCGAALAANYTNSGSGLFNAGATWIGGTAPTLAGDVFVITNGIVTYNANNSATAGWGASQIQNNGELRMTNSLSCYLKMNGNLSGNGLWTIGNSSNSMTFTVTNTVGAAIQFVSPAQCTMVGANNIRIYGDFSHLTNGTLTTSALSGTNRIVVNGIPQNVVSNDVIILGNSSVTGQVSYAFVVASVSGNIITLKTLAQMGYETNLFSYTVFNGSVPQVIPAGSCFDDITTPVVFYDPGLRGTAIITASQSNTISGVTVNGLGNGLAINCNGFTLSNCVANENTYGGFGGGSCNGWTLLNCMSTGNNSGGFAGNACNGWTLSNCVVNGSENGGLANNSCNGWVLSNCTANGNTYGGFAESSCYGWVLSSCTANENNIGGFAANICNGWVLSNCTATGNTYGGFGYNVCNGWTISHCTANGNLYGGFGNTSCNGWTISNCVNSDSETLMSVVNNIQYLLTTSYNDSYVSYNQDWAPICTIDSSWLYYGGRATNTGNGSLQFVNTTGNANIAAYETCSVRPGATRTVNVSCFQTNNVTYSAAFAFGNVVPPVWNFVSVPNNSLLWTNTSITLSNTNAYELWAYLWINASAPTITTGYANYSVGADSIILAQ